MPFDSQDRLIALAAVYQAVHCVLRIASQGSAEPAAMEPCLFSLLQVDAESVSDVYGPPGAVLDGARRLVAQLRGEPERNLELTRHVIQVIRLERSLSRRPEMLARIGQGIEQAKAKREHFDLLHPNLFAHFAELYSSTLSHLTPRIVIRGDPQHLRDTASQNRVRALLLAAVRAAMLWRQVGGSRLQILFGSKTLLTQAHRYINAHAQ